MNTFSVSNAIDAGWQLAKKHGLMLALLSFAWAIIANLISTPINAWAAVASGNSIALQEALDVPFYAPEKILVQLLSILVSMGFATSYLRIARGQINSFSFSCFSHPLAVYGKYIVYSIIMGVVVAIGLVFLIVPGLYLGARLWMGSYYILDHPEASLEDAFRFSWRATSGSAWTQVGFLLTLLLVGLAGLLACCVGLFFTSVISGFSSAVTYLLYNDAYDKGIALT